MPGRSSRRTAKLRETRDALEEIAKNPALAEAFEALHDLFQDDGFDTEYALGVAANEARSRGGSVAVRRLAKEVGVAEGRAHTAARVVRAFPPERVAEIRSRKTAYGFRLGLEHFKQFARVKNASERDALIERVFDELLSVDELRDEVDRVVADLWFRDATPEQGLARFVRGERAMARQIWRLLELAETPGDQGAEARRLLPIVHARGTELVRKLEALLRGSEKCRPN